MGRLVNQPADVGGTPPEKVHHPPALVQEPGRRDSLPTYPVQGGEQGGRRAVD